MSDASVGLIGNVTDLNKDGINPLDQRSCELGNTVEQASGQIEQAQSSLKAYGADAENVSVLSVSLKENLGNLAVQNKDVAQSQDSVTNSVENAGAAMDNAAESTGEFANQNKLAAETLNSLQVFAADIAANINDTFADLIFNGLKGNFDNLLDFWKYALYSMLNVFAQFIATVISNPIRIGLEGFLSGTAAGGGGGPGGPGGTNILSGLGGLVGGIGSGIGSSFGALGSLFGLGGSKSNNGGGGGYESEAEIVETGLGNVIEFPKKHILCSNRGNYKIAA